MRDRKTRKYSSTSRGEACSNPIAMLSYVFLSCKGTCWPRRYSRTLVVGPETYLCCCHRVNRQVVLSKCRSISVIRRRYSYAVKSTSHHDTYSWQRMYTFVCTSIRAGLGSSWIVSPPQLSPSIPPTCMHRSSIVRCSSLPSTSLLSVSEKHSTILLFCQFSTVSSLSTILSYSCVTT